MAATKYHVFLSHNWDDKPAVEELAHRLQREGIEPWLDKWHLIPGVSWQPAIEGALADCASCAVFIGPSGMGSWQHEEMRAAVDRRVKERRCDYRVIPVLLPGAQRPEQSRLPDFLTSTTWVEFRRSLDEEEAFQRLVCGIQGREPGHGLGRAVYAGEGPYRGLEAFDEAHAKFFFGREARTEWLLDALRPAPVGQENRFLAIIGSSGSGKSSLARAGLIPALRRGGIDGSADWPIVIGQPHTDPLESLAVALACVGDGRPGPSEVRRLVQDFRDGANGLHLFTRLALRGAPPTRRLVVLIDQFEEVFTLGQVEAARQAFLDNLLYAATIADGQTVVTLTLRADFYGKCASYPNLAAALAGHQELVGPMTEDELRRAIERPALLVGCEFEPGLVERLMHDVKGQAGALHLLQYALLELWKAREGRRLTNAGYETIGGLQGALENRANTILSDFTAPQRELCRRIFLRLTQPGEGTEDTKRRASMRELVPAGGDVAALDAVLRRLADARLITTEGDERHPDEGFVEVAHEALVRGWSELRRWIDADRAGLRTHRRLTESAREWDGDGRHRSDLYTGARLAVAREWAEAHRDELNPLEAEFLEASGAWEKQLEADEIEAARRFAAEAEARRRAEEDRAIVAERGEQLALARAVEERKRRRMTVALMASILATATLSIGGWTWYQRREHVRRDRTTQTASHAFDDAQRLGDQARASSNPTRWAEAIKAAEGVQRLLDSGGGDEALRPRVADALAAYRKQAEALETQERDRRMIAALDEARMLVAATNRESSGFDTKAVIPEYRRTFREYGIDPEIGTLQGATALIRSKPRKVREALAATFDDWAWRVNQPDGSGLLSIAREVDPDPLRNAIRDAIAKGDTPTLRQLTRDLDVAQHPIATLLRLGGALQQAGEFGDAVKLLQRAQRLYPGDFWINHDLASAFSSARPAQYDEAIRYLTAAVALRPGSSGVHNNLGFALDNKKDHDGAITAYREAIRLRPEYPEAHNNLGVILEESKGDHDGAIAAYREAIRLRPEYPEAHNNLGVALDNKGDHDGAIAAYREAIRLRPEYPEAHNGLGIALRRRGDHDGAIAAYREAIRLRPEYSDVLYNLGVALDNKGDHDGAIAAYREAIRLRPEYPEAHGNLGVALRNKGDDDGAIAAYREAIRLRPKYPEAHNNLGLALNSKGDHDGAIAAYREAIRLRPEYPEAHNNLGLALDNKGDDDDAIAAYREAIHLRPEYPEAHGNLGYIYHSKSLYAASAHHFEEALRVKPEWAEDLQAGHRYNAACAAALAGTGRGRDAADQKEEQRAQRRSQARDWLQADLTAWDKIMEASPPQARDPLQKELRHWQDDPDLAGLRGEDALAKLPEAERAAWRVLWAEVEALIERAEGRGTPKLPSGELPWPPFAP